MQFDLGWLEVLLIDFAALVTIVSYYAARDARRQAIINDRFIRLEDKQSDLTAACLRREEIAPINHQLTEIRHRVDELFALQKSSKK